MVGVLIIASGIICCIRLCNALEQGCTGFSAGAVEHAWRALTLPPTRNSGGSGMQNIGNPSCDGRTGTCPLSNPGFSVGAQSILAEPKWEPIPTLR